MSCRARAAIMIASSTLAAAACGQSEETLADREYAATVLEARVRFPVMLNLHQDIFAKTCAATNGVCHNAREYPDLHTPGNLLAAISAPCNAEKAPSDIFDACEPEADRLVLEDDSWSTAIAWMGVEEWNDNTHSLYRRVVLEAPPPSEIARAPAKIVRAGRTIAVLPEHLTVAARSTVGEIHDLAELDYQSLNDVRGGDPNHNGELGAAHAWSLVTPGRPEASYLLARLKAEVPGTQMPPLQTTLGEAELLAISCWIETLKDAPAAFDAIDYDRCAAASSLLDDAPHREP